MHSATAATYKSHELLYEASPDVVVAWKGVTFKATAAAAAKILNELNKHDTDGENTENTGNSGNNSHIHTRNKNNHSTLIHDNPNTGASGIAAHATPPSSPAPSQTPPPPPKPSTAPFIRLTGDSSSAHTMEERREAAYDAGQNAGKKATGQIQYLPPTRRLTGGLQKHYWVIIKSKSGCEKMTGIFESKRDAFPNVFNYDTSSYDDQSVFHGWPSKSEAGAYWAGAQSIADFR